MEYKLKDGKLITLRDAKVSDAEKIIEYMHRINKETTNLLREPGEFTMTLEQEEKFLENTIKSPTNHMYLALDGDLIVSCSGFHGRELNRIKHKAELGISILTDYRGLGLGTIMMNALIDKAREMGLKKLELDVREDNPNAIKLYEKVGFFHEGARKASFYIDGKYLDLIVMGILL